MTKSNIILLSIFLLMLGAVSSYYLGYDVAFEKAMKSNELNQSEDQKMTTFAECVAAGNPIMESYPRQCRSQSGELFVETLAEPGTKHDLIRVFSPQPERVITSPLNIRGEARGSWFFEANFPIILTDWDGRIIAQHYTEAQGEWMTEEFVPFKATLEFDSPFKAGDPEFMSRGTLIFGKSNASGLPEHDDALEFTVYFPQPGQKEFNDPGFGLKFIYPAKMTLHQAEENVTVQLFGSSQADGTEVYDGLVMSFSKVMKASKSLDSFAQAEVEEFKIHGTIQKPLTEITLAGQSGYMFIGEGLGVFDTYLLPLDDTYFLRLSILEEDPTKQGFAGISQAVLNSLEIMK